ncbi:MAG: sugar phosphate nucleotidyltransferase, partial [Proteobacteria bacterium]|nr:sugar phosphate nucleotidyltransferase [Pseudomonadota bacterium]
MKALILAAGLGSRLRPLTLRLPKPLCLFYGQTMLDLVYRQIRSIGIEHIAINSHHLAKQIEQHIKNNQLVYSNLTKLSYEPEILGTGGAINPLRSWLGSDDLLICNSDIIADINLSAAYKQHRENQADATMVLLDRHKLGTTPIYTQDHGVLSIGESTSLPKTGLSRHTFSGIHILGPKLVNAIPRQGFHSIINSYQRLISEGSRIQAFQHKGFWEDLGTPRDYYEAHQTLFRQQDRNNICLRLGLDPDSIYWDNLHGSAYCGNSHLGESRIDETFVMGPISGNATIQSSLVYPNVRFSP